MIGGERRRGGTKWNNTKGWSVEVLLIINNQDVSLVIDRQTYGWGFPYAI